VADASLPDEDCPVLVVGGGLVGLSTAAFLGSHGVPAMLVERRSTTSPFPRVRLIHGRTMECYLDVAGLVPQIRANPSMLAAYPEMARADTVMGPEAFRGPMERLDEAQGLSPVDWAPVDQHRLEPLLRTHAEASGVDVRFGTTLRSWVERDDHVEAVLTSASGERTVRARYLVAADGARSGIRRDLNIPINGPGIFRHYTSILFEADLDRVLRGRKVGLWFLNEPVSGTVLLPHEQRDRWVLMTPRPEDPGETEWTERHWRNVVHQAVGDDFLPIRLLRAAGADDAYATRWSVGAGVADKFRSGRIFLAGDAAHLIPPSGGFGANVGVQDGHNLAWKLAHVLAGSASEALLESYSDERIPVARFTLDEALHRAEARVGSDDGDDGADSTLTVVYGYRYRSSAVLGADPDAPVADDPRNRTAEPGTRAPHLFVARDGAELSTLELFGNAWTILTEHDIGPTARRVGLRLGIKLNAVALKSAVDSWGRAWWEVFGVTPAGVVLVRPDGFVAWRTRTTSVTWQTEFTDVLRTLLFPMAENN
jgi:putative polyketide hydroxylase